MTKETNGFFMNKYYSAGGELIGIKPRFGRIIGGVVGSVLALSLMMGSVFVNSEYERSVITKLGEFNRTAGAGVHFKIPFVESVHTADLRIEELSYPTVVAMKDGQAVGLTLSINHQILNDDENLRALYKQFGSSFSYEDRLFRNLAIDRAKGVIGRYQLEEFMPNREKIRLEAKEAVIEAVTEYGINVEDLQMADIEFSPQYKQRLEQVAAARAEAAKAEQNARRESFNANKVIETARGQAESQERLADAAAYERDKKSIAEAEAIRREGEAKAAALKAQADVLKNSQGLVELTKAEAMKNWNGVFNPNVAMFGGESGNGLLPFMNVADQIKK